MGDCKYCNGTGIMHVERGSSLSYTCTDCNGSGVVPVCEVCGEEYYGEFCERCYCECASCGEVARVYEGSDVCEDCYNEGMDSLSAAFTALEVSEEYKKVGGQDNVEFFNHDVNEYTFRIKLSGGYIYTNVFADSEGEAISKFRRVLGDRCTGRIIY